MRQTSLPAILAAAILVWFLLPATTRAEVKCPWLNAATASGVLGGDVLMNVKKATAQVEGKGSGAAMYSDQVRADRFDASCTFTRRADSGVSMLKIVVKTMADPAVDFPQLLASCAGRAVSLKGIGNEAIHCTIQSGGHVDSGGQEQVIARVRDRSFVLMIRREAKSQEAKTQTGAENEVLSDEARNVAEQIAGSLF